MTSLREYQYSRALAEAGFSVTLFTSTGSNVWRFNRAGLKPTDPTENDKEFVALFGVNLIRRRALLRVSDLFFILPPIREIRRADVVHVIEFRQGFTVLIALIAKAFGKTVVYDHEQRGDRKYTVLHRVDSVIRRILIFTGSFFVDQVRHTVVQNGDFFKSNSIRRPDMTLAPLGGDESKFSYDAAVRDEYRSRLGLKASDLVAVLSGKMTRAKRPVEVVRASIEAGWKIIVVGRIDTDLQRELAAMQGAALTLIDWADSNTLNGYYNAADAVVFTAFSVSYWEAAMTGAEVIVPRSRFSDVYVGNDPNFHLFGSYSMFELEDEEIRPDFDVATAIKERLVEIQSRMNRRRGTSDQYSWKAKRDDLIEFYQTRFGTLPAGKK